MHADGDKQRGCTNFWSFVVLQHCLYRDGLVCGELDGTEMLQRVRRRSWLRRTRKKKKGSPLLLDGYVPVSGMLAAAVLLAAAVVLVTLHRASAQATSGAHRWHPQDPRHARRRAVVESNSAWLLRASTGDPGAQCSSESCPDSTMPWSSPLTGTSVLSLTGEGLLHSVQRQESRTTGRRIFRRRRRRRGNNRGRLTGAAAKRGRFSATAACSS